MENPGFTNNLKILSNTKASGPQFTAFLRQINSIPDAPHVHCKAIAYKNGTDRRNWAGCLPEDSHSRSTISEFWKEAKQEKKVWLGCFTTTTESTVRHDWDKLVWYVWGVAVIKATEGRGKHIIIWDCDPRTTHNAEGELQRQKNIMFGFQKNFIAYAKKNCLISGLWYNTDNSKSGENKCLRYTLEWILDMALIGDVAFQGKDDLRIQKCVLLSRL